MQDDKPTREGQTGMPAKSPEKDPRKDPKNDPKKDPRQDRLKMALRENLKRRKSQARGRVDLATAPSNGDDTTPHDEGRKKPG
jgi:hypothetical protein